VPDGSVRGDQTQWQAFADGYGDPGSAADDRLRLYELFHVVELWCWFAERTKTEPLPALATPACVS
jgi:hypothetical protein